jgi:hypothetical protein
VRAHRGFPPIQIHTGTPRVSADSGPVVTAWDGYLDLKERRWRSAGGNLSEEEMINEVFLISRLWFWGSWLRVKDNDAAGD